MKHKWLIGFALLACMAGMAIGADEVTVSALLKVVNGNFSLTRNVSNLKIDQAGTASDYAIQSIDTTTNSLTVKNVTTPHYMFARNLGTNDVFVTCTLKFREGDVAVLPLSTTNVTAFVTNGTSDFESWINQE